MVSDAVQFVKHSEHRYEVNESSIQTIGKFVVIYFVNIMIFSKNEREHQDHLTEIMKVLECEKLYGNLKKCSFFTLRSLF